LIRWEAPGPYTVAFSTRAGGASSGPYESLNLGLLTGDDPANVHENRRRLCSELGTDAERLAMPLQRHGATVIEARAAEKGRREADAIWSDEREQALLVVTADCVPVALARANGRRPALALVHVGWSGILAGIVRAAAGALGSGRLAAAIGPGIGPCCYEVREDVAEPFRARFGREIVHDGRLDLWSATEQELRAAGCDDVERVDLCTFCHPQLFFSHRRDRGVTGRQGAIGYVA
jgi:YfiH family protein